MTATTPRLISGMRQRPLSVGIVSTYPPTACGLATFTSALVGQLRAASPALDVRVVRVSDGVPAGDGPEVVALLRSGEPTSVARAARALDAVDVAVVQHEYGIYGGASGAEVLDLLAAITTPIVVVTHTVLEAPSAAQRAVLSAVCDRAETAVAMTGIARDRLVQRYGVDQRKVVVIPHGAIVPRAGRPAPRHGPPRLLTWGLLGPGKGIEWAVDALALLRDLRPAPHYLVAGRTHPKVLEEQGEAYRASLLRRARRRGVTGMVTLDGRYRPASSLRALVRGADVVVLPYESTEQVTSGVLIEAVACGKPVVATAFPHAVELLGDGAGLLVGQRDPEALAAALRRVLTEPGLARRLAERAAAIAPSLAWGTVAHRYLQLLTRLQARRVA